MRPVPARLIAVALLWMLVGNSPPVSLRKHPGEGHGTSPSPSPTAVWHCAAQATAARSEYSLGPLPGPGQPAFQAPNRAHGFRAVFDAEGLRLTPRVASEGTWELRMHLASVGFAGNLEPTAPRRLSREANRAEYAANGITEWYVNDERGLEQGFTLASPPGARGPGPLRLELAVSGNATPRLADDATAVAFEREGQVVLSYAGLVSRDARGRELPSRIELDESEDHETALSLVVDVAGAEYPVTVDPLVTSPSWVKDGGQAGAQFGAFLAAAGDVNGDGYGDVIVGAPYFDTGAADAGRAFVYHGSPTGPSAVPDWTTDGSGAGALYGVVAGAGDVNGDGYDDVIVGSPLATNGETNEGTASVYLGGPSGLSTSPVWTGEGDQVTAAFGSAVGGAGDVNGDGYADVIVGAPNYDNGEVNEGRVFVYLGSAAGPTGAPWTAESNQGSALFGSSVTGGGDFNRDGYADIAVGAPYWDQAATDNGRVFVYHGSASRLPGAATRALDQPAATNRNNAHYGQSLAVVGDVNADGYSDLLVGEPNWLSDFYILGGRASLYLGSGTGLGSTVAWTNSGGSDFAQYGLSVASAGDVDGDGYADWLVGQPKPAGLGAAYLYRGASSLASVASTQLPSFPATSQASARYGISVASAGDVNGDGFSDVLIGTDLYDGTLTDEGRALLYLGTPGTAIGTTAIWQYQTNGYNLQFGQKVVLAGDVNGDGYPDVFVSSGNWKTVYAFYGTGTGLAASPSWSFTSTSATWLSYSINPAGDVNGDGYSDVVIGESSWGNGETDEGRALVFLGSASGLGSSPAWAVEPDLAGAALGASVAGAGDVNGDGYGDVIVGATGYGWSGAGSGIAFLYLGSPTGLSTSWSWFATGEQANAHAGGSVAGVGDVNGDGFADVAVGASGWSNGETSEGRVAVYLGGPSGPAASPSWTAEGNQASAFFSSVAPAGDVNGDGFADVVVVAPLYDNGSTDEGRVYVYHGSSAGLPANANWTWEPDASSQSMTARAAGDVNGDGYGDLVVGRPGYYGSYDDDGIAHVFFGSAAGITTAGYWSVTQSAQYGASFGSSVGTAGDVNGDGRADIIVGASKWQDVYPLQVSEGTAFVYSMPAVRPGRSLTLRGGGQTALVPPEGRAYDPDDFQVRLTSVSPYGRIRVKAEVEACTPGVAWGSASCTHATSPSWLDVNSTSPVTATLSVPGLVPRTLYRWRARTLYAPSSVTQPGIVPPIHPRHGPWRRWQGQTNSGDVRIDQGITVSLTQAASSVDETSLQTTFGATMVTADGQPNLYPVTIQFQTADGTATAGSDYTATTATITWTAGLGSTVTQYRNIPLAGGDGLSEGPETFSVNLSLPVNAALAAPTSQVVTIIDSDPPLVSIGDASVVEGNSGTTTANFTVNLSYASSNPASVSWATAAGSASPGSDFVAASGSVSFAPLQTSQTVPVIVNGDTLDEGDETFQVVLSSPLGAAPGDATAVGTIQNDDGPTGDAVTVFAATAGNGRADLQWVYPADRDTIRIRYTEGPTCTPPADPENSGTLLGGADVSGTAGQPATAPHSSLQNGTQYCYRIWTVLGGGSYAMGGSTHTRPFDNSVGQPGEPIAWAYSTGASSVAAPGLGGDVVLAVSNDHLVHAMVRGSGAGAGRWPSGYVARVLDGLVQGRPPLIPLSVVPGSTNFTLLGSQDGSVYAVDAQRGGIKWRAPLLPAGTAVQAAPAAFFAAFGAPFGVNFDLVVAGTRNGGGMNRFYALDAATGSVVGTPFDNGGGATDIGFVSGSASLDYPTKRAYFTSRSAGSPSTLWCFDVSALGLSLGWVRPAGEIDASPVLRNGVVYTSTIEGDVMAYRADNGNPLWTAASLPSPFPTEVGGVKGFIFADRLSQELYFSTTTKVWAVRDDGGAPFERWSTTAVPAPSTLTFAELNGVGYLFVGGGDGRLYQLDAATGTQVKWIQLGTASDLIGSPTLDILHSMVYAGSTAGIVYAVEVPLP